MKKSEKEELLAAAAPGNMAIFRARGVYQRLLLCEYLRELPEYPVPEAEETQKEASLSPSRLLPVSR